MRRHHVMRRQQHIDRLGGGEEVIEQLVELREIGVVNKRDGVVAHIARADVAGEVGRIRELAERNELQPLPARRVRVHRVGGDANAMAGLFKGLRHREHGIEVAERAQGGEQDPAHGDNFSVDCRYTVQHLLIVHW